MKHDEASKKIRNRGSKVLVLMLLAGWLSPSSLTPLIESEVSGLDVEKPGILRVIVELMEDDGDFLCFCWVG